MKSVTEFPVFTLDRGLKAKAALAAEGKSPEEIQTSLGETFKYEGDKLKHFLNAMDVASANTADLRRVVVITLADGERVPAKATKVEEHHYVPEFNLKAAPASSGGKDQRGGRGGRRGGGDSKKGSPWGLSPEEKAAKKGAAKPAN